MSHLLLIGQHCRAWVRPFSFFETISGMGITSIFDARRGVDEENKRERVRTRMQRQTWRRLWAESEKTYVIPDPTLRRHIWRQETLMNPIHALDISSGRDTLKRNVKYNCVELSHIRSHIQVIVSNWSGYTQHSWPGAVPLRLLHRSSY